MPVAYSGKCNRHAGSFVLAGMLMNLDDAAEILALSPSGLRKLVRRRAIQFFQDRPHSPIKFRREWLDEYIDRHTTVIGGPTKPVKRTKPVPLPTAGLHGFDASLLPR